MITEKIEYVDILSGYSSATGAPYSARIVKVTGY